MNFTTVRKSFDLGDNNYVISNMILSLDFFPFVKDIKPCKSNANLEENIAS